MKQDYTKAQSGRRNILLVSALLFTAWMCRLPFLSISPSPYLSTALGLLRPFIYIGLCAGWSASISGKIISRQLRFYLNAMAVCCIIWLFLRTVKFELTVNGDLLNLILVHGFNFCFILIPTFGFFASLYTRKSDRYRIPTLLLIFVSGISVTAIIFVSTNPLHKMFWKSIGEPYTRGHGYKFVMMWIIFLTVMTLLIITTRAKVPGRKRPALLPLLVLLVIAAYFGMHFFFPNAWKFLFGDYTSFTCIAAIGLIQACITAGMIPVNTGYAKVFEASNKDMLITDDDWSVCYASAGARIPNLEALKNTEDGTFTIDRNTILKGCRLHPGHLVWSEDISALTNSLEELVRNKNELSARNELDKENSKTELAISKAQEKNRLYDLSQAATAKQNKLLHETLARYGEETDATTKRYLLAKAAVLGSYIKRKGNMIFAGDKDGSVKASELRLSFSESLNNLELMRTECYIDFSLGEKESLSLNTAFLFYDSFEAVLEALLPDIRFAFVQIKESSGIMNAVYRFASANVLKSSELPNEAQLEHDGDSWIVTLSLPKGGDVK